MCPERDCSIRLQASRYAGYLSRRICSTHFRSCAWCAWAYWLYFLRYLVSRVVPGPVFMKGLCLSNLHRKIRWSLRDRIVSVGYNHNDALHADFFSRFTALPNIVLKRICKSSQMLQLSMYHKSSSIRFLMLVSPRSPLICAHPVIPGFT